MRLSQEVQGGCHASGLCWVCCCLLACCPHATDGGAAVVAGGGSNPLPSLLPDAPRRMHVLTHVPQGR